MSPSQPPHHLPGLHAALAKAGLIASQDTLTSVEHDISFPREAADDRRHFSIDAGGQTLCHVVVGHGLAREFAQLQAFHQDCPELACRPLALLPGPEGMDALCMEHFTGLSLDAMVQQQRCSAAQWLGIVERAQAHLAATAQPSDTASVARELHSLVEAIVDRAALPVFDQRLLREVVVPLFTAHAGTTQPTTRWSNGDFVGRNLLVNERGDIRLIDYEYLSRTHFWEADRLRLREFSVRTPEIESAVVSALSVPPSSAAQAYFWLHHLWQLQKISASPERSRLEQEAIGSLFLALRDEAENGSPANVQSYLLPHLSAHQAGITRALAATCLENRRMQDEHAKAILWAKSLEADLQKAQADFAAQGRTLEQERDVERNAFAKLQAEFTERTAWAKSLEADLQKAQADFAAQAQLVEERTAWARSLEADVEKAQVKFAAQTQLVEERTTWAKTVDAELQHTRKIVEHLSGELSLVDTANQRLQAEHAAAQRELAIIHAACTALSDALPQTAGSTPVDLLQNAAQSLLRARHDLIAHERQVDLARGQALKTEIQAAVAGTTALRLATALGDAQSHVDQLLEQIRILEKQSADARNLHVQEMQAAMIERNMTLLQLARYENVLVCRLAVRLLGRRGPATAKKP